MILVIETWNDYIRANNLAIPIVTCQNLTTIPPDL